MAVRFRAVKPTRLNLDEFRKARRRALIDAGKQVLPDFKLISKTWKGEKPEYESVTKEIGSREIELFVGVRDLDSQGGKKFMWLNDGTKVRYAMMMPGFQPKTARRTFNSSAGQGGVMRVDKSKPLPGIEAREWDEEAMDKWEKPLAKKVQEAIEGAAKASGHAI